MNRIEKSEAEIATAVSSGEDGIAALAAIIEQNQAQIKRGYEELARLDAILETLNAREASLMAKRQASRERQVAQPRPAAAELVAAK